MSRGGQRAGAGRRPHPWRTLTEAAVAYANAETEEEYARAGWRLRSAAIRFRDERAPQGRPVGAAALDTGTGER